MNVLVDTSVWVAHFRKANADLITLLVSNRVLGHPLALAEIACATPPSPREQTLDDMALIGQAHTASFTEIIAFIESEPSYGLGCGFVDIALLASACITPDAKLLTHDKKLMQLAKRLEVDFKLVVH
jgi:predicted nucleic acid-binding protein